MEIFAVELDTFVNTALYNKLLARVSKNRQRTIARFRRNEDAQRSMFSELLIRFILSRYLNIPTQKIRFGTNEFGKPFLEGNDSVNFNLSHSGRWVLCAVDNFSVGIDIEEIVPVDLEISENYFTPEEHLSIMSADSHSRLDLFFEYWVLKESFIKAAGKGLSIPLKSFSINLDNRDLITLKHTKQYSEFHYFKLFDIDASYKTAACSPINNFPERVKIIDRHDLITHFK